MPIETGRVVRSLAGHDAGTFFMTVSAGEGFVFLSDGKSRPLAHPKRKSVKHIRKTNTVLEPEGFATDKKLREALRAFCENEGEEPLVQGRCH